MTADPATGRPVTRYYSPTPATAAQPERKRERRQRKERHWTAAQSAAVVGYLWLLLVIVCVGAMSWTGLVRFAQDVLKLPEPLCYGVPVALDGSAITLAFLALRGVLSGGAAGLPRLLAVIVVAASSGFNYYQARLTGQGGAAEVFFAGMSVLVYVMFEVVLRHNRRQHLAELGAIEPPLARFRMARWLRFPIRTWRAWSAAVDQGLTDPQEALTIDRRKREPVETPQRQPEPSEPVTLPPVASEPPEPFPTPPARPRPARRKAGKTSREQDQRVVRALLLEHGDSLTARQAGEAVGKSRSWGQQLLTSEKAALTLAAKNGDGPPNGSTPAAS